MSLIPFCLVLLISLGVSFLAARRKTEFFLANRSFTWPMLLGTFLGAQIGGGFILGSAEESFHSGLCGAMYGLSLSIGMLLLGCGFAGRLRRLGIGTLPELLERKYGGLQKVSSVVSILSLAGGLMCQAIGLKKFLASMGCDGDCMYAVSWGCVVLYTTYGGLLAVVWTDVIQAMIMIGMLWLRTSALLLPQANNYGPGVSRGSWDNTQFIDRPCFSSVLYFCSARYGPEVFCGKTS